jgi:hypothetical protein
MVCVNLKGYTRACGAVTGGISDIGIFDPNDLNFTQVAAIDGVTQQYSAVAERATVVSPSVFIVNFQVDEGEWTWKQSVKGCSVKYEHEFVFQLTENAQLLTTFQQAMDAAGCCCGIGLIVRLNSGKIFVAGEKYVNEASIPRFTIKQDGSDGSSGKLFDDYNGGNIHFKGSYSRNLYEYSGTWDSIIALSDQAGS